MKENSQRHVQGIGWTQVQNTGKGGMASGTKTTFLEAGSGMTVSKEMFPENGWLYFAYLCDTKQARDFHPNFGNIPSLVEMGRGLL